MKAGDTIRVRGEGGAEWDQDVPELGTNQRELLDHQIAKGTLFVVHDPDPDVAEAPAPPVTATAVADLLVSAVDNFARLDDDAQVEVLGYLDEVRPDLTELGDALTSVAHTEAPPAGGGSERPNVRDGKAEWVTYAIAQGADPDEAAAMTKEQLIERFGKDS